MTQHYVTDSIFEWLLFKATVNPPQVQSIETIDIYKSNLTEYLRPKMETFSPTDPVLQVGFCKWGESVTIFNPEVDEEVSLFLWFRVPVSNLPVDTCGTAT